MDMPNEIDKSVLRVVLRWLLILVALLPGQPLLAGKDPGNGASVIVAFQPGTTSQDITHIEEKYGLQFTKALAAAQARVYRVPPNRSLRQTLDDLGKERVVRYAEVDHEVTAHEE